MLLLRPMILLSSAAPLLGALRAAALSPLLFLVPGIGETLAVLGKASAMARIDRCLRVHTT